MYYVKAVVTAAKHGKCTLNSARQSSLSIFKSHFAPGFLNLDFIGPAVLPLQ